MATTKQVPVTSYLLNSTEFNRWQEKKDKHGNSYKDPIGDPIVIEGLNAYKKRTGMIVPHVTTNISEEDANYIKENYKHSAEIRCGGIFFGVTTETGAPEFGNEPVKAPTVGAVEVKAK